MATQNDVPILELIPREILESVFNLCRDFKTPVRDLVTLQLVCRRWFDIIAEASFLWGTIASAEGTRAVLKALGMARLSPLDLMFTECPQIETSEFFNLTGEKMDQWRSLHIETYKMNDALAIIQSQKPPKLDLLNIIEKSYLAPKTADAVLFGGGPATGLKYIKLCRTPINLSSLRLSGLKSLVLQDIPFITVTDILSVLADSPTLKILDLAKLKGAVLPTEPATGEPNPLLYPPIQLPSLFDIEFSDLTLSFLGLLLSILIVPRLQFLTVKTKQPIAQLLGANKRHLTATLMSAISGAEEYEVTMSRRYKITIEGLCIGLDWPTSDPTKHFQETFDRLSDHLKAVDLAGMPLHLTLEDSQPQHFDLQWFTRRTNVTWLTISNEPFRDYDLMEVIPWLGQPTSGPSPIWLLPQLEVFETDLACAENQNQILDMIKSRHAALPASFPGSHGPFPKRFQEVWLYNNGEKFPIPSPLNSFMSDVIQASEGADVYWGGRKWTDWLSESNSRPSQV